MEQERPQGGQGAGVARTAVEGRGRGGTTRDVGQEWATAPLSNAHGADRNRPAELVNFDDRPDADADANREHAARRVLRGHGDGNAMTT